MILYKIIIYLTPNSNENIPGETIPRGLPALPGAAAGLCRLLRTKNLLIQFIINDHLSLHTDLPRHHRHIHRRSCGCLHGCLLPAVTG